MISPGRPGVIDAILALNCTFEGCTFINVGFTGASELVQPDKASLGSTWKGQRYSRPR